MKSVRIKIGLLQERKTELMERWLDGIDADGFSKRATGQLDRDGATKSVVKRGMCVKWHTSDLVVCGARIRQTHTGLMTAGEQVQADSLVRQTIRPEGAGRVRVQTG